MRSTQGGGGFGGGRMKVSGMLLLVVVASFMVVSFGQDQFINVGNAFPTFYDTYGTMYKNEPGYFIVRCEATQGQSCVQNIALDCNQVVCASCVFNSVGDNCANPPDDNDYIKLPDTAVYYDNGGTRVGVNYETFQILRIINNGTLMQTRRLVEMYMTILDAPILPVPTSQTVQAQTDETITIEMEGEDAEGRGYEVFVTSLPIQGTLLRTNGDPIVLGETINSREVEYTAASVIVDDQFTFGVRSDSDVVGGGSTGEIGIVEIEIETSTVKALDDQVVEVVESVEIDFDLTLENPNGVAYVIELTSTPQGALRTQAASMTNLVAGSTFSTDAMVYTPPAITDQFGSDYVDYVVRVGGNLVSSGSVLFKISTAGFPVTTTFIELAINAGEETCIDLRNFTAALLTAADATYYVTALTQEGTIEDSCNIGGSEMDEPGAVDETSFQIVADSSVAGSYTTAVEWRVVETSTGLASAYNIIYFRVTDLANIAPVAVSTSIAVRQASQGLLFLTGYSPVNNPLQPEIVSCPSRTTLGALYQSTNGQVILCDRNRSPIEVENEDDTVLYRADTGRPSYDYRFRFQMRDTITGEASDPVAVFIFVQENQTPVALGGSFIGNEDIDLVIDRSGGTGWGTDPDGDILTTFISRPPQKGELYQYLEDDEGNLVTGPENKIVVFEPVRLTDPSNRVIFKPRENANGEPYDAFSFVVKDDLNATSNEQRIIVTINALPDPPTARQILLPNQNEDELFNIALLGDDPDVNDVLTSLITSLPAKGFLYQFDDCVNNTCNNEITSASLEDPVIVTNVDQKVWYQPFDDEIGADFFNYKVSDGTRESGEGVVNITLNDVNDPPTANDSLTNAVEFATDYTITLEVDDIDDPSNKLLAIIETLPEGGKLFQADDSGAAEVGGDIVQVPTTVTNPDRKVVYRALGGDIQPSTDYNFTFVGRDPERLESEPATVFLQVSADNRETSSGGISIGVIVGAVIGVVCLAFCAIIWWIRRRRRMKDKERNVFNLLYNNKSSIELLENILVEEDLAVILALAEHVTGPELDEFGEAMVAIFESHGMLMPVMKQFLKIEIQNTEDLATLFRLNCVATAMMKFYSKQVGYDYLKGTIGELTEQTLSNVGAYEVDPTKLKEGQDLDENWETLKEATQTYLHAITESVEDCPLEFREIYAYLLKEIEKAFPKCKNAHTFIGGFIFLRFFCPAMIAPEGYKLVDTTPTLPERRGLILISKSIQNLSNGVQFGPKEAFMFPMNQFIIENLHRVKRFLEEVSTYPQVSEEEVAAVLASRPPVSNDRKEDALQSAHRLLCEYQDEVVKDLQDACGGEEVEETDDPLEDFHTLLDMNASDWEGIAKFIIGDMNIIRAFCQSLQSQDISQALITVFEAHDMTMPILSDLIKCECQEANRNPNMLLRGNGTAFKMFKCYVEIIGLDYLQKTLSMMVKFICNNVEGDKGYEVDPAKCPPDMTEDDIKENAERLKEAVNEMWGQIVGSVDQIPVQIRILCRHLFMQVSETAPDRAHMVTGDFIFNRMLGPAIVTPMAYGLMDDEPSPESRRALLLVTKVMMMIVHDVQIAETKEAFLRPLSHLVVDLHEDFRKFIEKVIDVNPNAVDNDRVQYKVTPALLQDSVESVFKQMQNPRTQAQMRSLLQRDAREQGTVAERLRNILQDLGPAAARKRVVAPGGATKG